MADSDIVDIGLKKKDGMFFKTFHKANKDIQFDLMSEESKGTQVLFL